MLETLGYELKGDHVKKDGEYLTHEDGSLINTKDILGFSKSQGIITSYNKI